MSSIILSKIEQYQRQQRKEYNEAIFRTKRRIIIEKKEEIINQISQEQFQKIQSYIIQEYDKINVIIERFKLFSYLVKTCIDYLQPDNNQQLSQMVSLLNLHKQLKRCANQVGSDQQIPIKQKKKVLDDFEQEMIKLLFSNQNQNTQISDTISLSKQIYDRNANLELRLQYDALKKEMQKKEIENQKLLMFQVYLKTLNDTNQQLEERLKRHNEEFQIYKDKQIYENSLLEKEILVLKSVISDLKDQLQIQYPQLEQLPIIEQNVLNNENFQFLKNSNSMPQKEKKKLKKIQESIF